MPFERYAERQANSRGLPVHSDIYETEDPEFVPPHIRREVYRETLAERIERAQTICQAGDYDVIREIFDRRDHINLLEEQVEIFRDEHEFGDLRATREHLEDHDWEMLTILKLFDIGTYEHSIRVYKKIHEKISGQTRVSEYLKNCLESSRCDFRCLEKSALLHDIGKIALVPRDTVLNNSFKDTEWQTAFEAFCLHTKPEQEARATIEHYHHYLKRNRGERAKDITPVFIVLNPEQRKHLESLGTNIKVPIGKLIRVHQDVSIKIASKYYPIDGDLVALVGNHHERSESDRKKLPYQLKDVSRPLIDALRISDLYDAYHHERPYKIGHPPLRSMAFLIKKLQDKIIEDQELLLYWLEDEFERIDIERYRKAIKSSENDEYIAKEEAAFLEIKEFLDKKSILLEQ